MKVLAKVVSNIAFKSVIIGSQQQIVENKIKLKNCRKWHCCFKRTYFCGIPGPYLAQKNSGIKDTVAYKKEWKGMLKLMVCISEYLW